MKKHLLVPALLFLLISCGNSDGEPGKASAEQPAKSGCCTDVPCTGPKTADATVPAEKAGTSDVKVTFIELGSVNCIPCKMMVPVMKYVEDTYGSQVKVIFHDVWTPAGKPMAQHYGIRSIPTQVFLDKDGNEYYRHEGFFAQEELVKILAMQGVE